MLEGEEMKDEIQKVILGTNEALRVTADGEFIWHPEADAMIEDGDFTSSPAMRHILRALRKAIAAPDLQAELDATNRQVEILSDALAESRRDIDAMIALARADEREACAKVIESWRKWGADVALLVKAIRTMSDPVCTTSPAAQRQ
jgi:hypothetical protein